MVFPAFELRLLLRARTTFSFLVLILLLVCGSGCCSPGGRAGVQFMLAEDGVRISYTSEGVGEPTLVFVHGWSCDREHWRFQVPEFRKSHRVVTIDLAGHGASGRDRETWSIDGLGRDVARVVLGLKLENVVLVGHSLGGPVALAAAPRLSGVLLGIVPVDSLHNVEYVSPDGAGERFIKRFEDDFDGAWVRFMRSFFSDPDSEQLKWILEKGVTVDREAATELLASYNEFDWAGGLAAAGVPVRAINAAEPHATEVEANRKYGDFDVLLMDGVGHFLMLEKAGEFNGLLRGIVKALRRE